VAGSSGFLFDEVRVVQALLDFWLTKGKRGMLFGIFCETIEIRAIPSRIIVVEVIVGRIFENFGGQRRSVPGAL
jgi:hypothetical protein